MENYEIGSQTLAIIPIDEKISKIYEENTEYLVEVNVWGNVMEISVTTLLLPNWIRMLLLS